MTKLQAPKPQTNSKVQIRMNQTPELGENPAWRVNARFEHSNFGIWSLLGA
jgi:hypothetical protein